MDNSALAMVFPGQGSQKVGMLAELALQFPLILRVFEEGSTALEMDLWQMAQSGDRLDQTEWTQPILLVASIAIWRLWQAQGGALPSILAGHSLGEYSALVAAEAISLADGVRLVHRRGQLMQQAVPSGQGAMAAIIGLDDYAVVALCEQVSIQTHDTVQAANFNAVGQVVVAGSQNAVAAAIAAAKAQGGKAIFLPVSVPSHCNLMRDAASQFAEDLARVDLAMPKIPVIHNVSATTADDLAQMRQYLIEQLYQSVQWTQTLQQFQQRGITQIVECGAGNVLSNLAKRLPFVAQALPTDTVARFEQAIATSRSMS